MTTFDASPAGFVDAFASHVAVTNDVFYAVRSGIAQRLDFYRLAGPAPRPTLLFFHGGGWMTGDKALSLWGVLPWLARGWNVANANYRLGTVASAPAAVEDARAAFRWLHLNAAELGVDPERIVLSGNSAGGHLALMAAFLPERHAFDNGARFGVSMPAAQEATRIAAGGGVDWEGPLPPPLAVVNWYGITDIDGIAVGNAAKGWAVAWLGARLGDGGLREALSPCRLVRPGTCPVITVHGTADGVVPYEQARQLHRALEATGVPNRLVPIVGGGHGGFEAAPMAAAVDEVARFLAACRPAGSPISSSADA